MRLAPIKGRPGISGQGPHARNHLAAAQYFEQHNIRGHFTALTQMLMVHQPSDALRFMHNEIGRLIDEQDQMQAVDYSEAIADGACVVRVHAEYEGPDGKRKRTFTRLVPCEDRTMRQRAEQEASNTVHDVWWGGEQPPSLSVTSPTSGDGGPQRTTSAARKRVSLNKPAISKTPSSGASVPSAGAVYEMAVLMCTYAAMGLKDQLEDLLNSGVDVDTGDYDKRTGEAIGYASVRTARGRVIGGLCYPPSCPSEPE